LRAEASGPLAGYPEHVQAKQGLITKIRMKKRTENQNMHFASENIPGRMGAKGP
jgi:hypothetical protein